MPYTNYEINPLVTVAGGGAVAPDKAVLYWEAATNAIRGSADLLFDATLKTLTLGAVGQFRIYNTYTDASNYERGEVLWEGNAFQLRVVTAGTGEDNRSIQIKSAGTGTVDMYTNGTGRWFVTGSGGHLSPWTDATYDLGQSAARVRTIYSSGGYSAGTASKSADYTVTANDHVIRVDASGGNKTITLPAAASHTGRIIHIKKTDSSANYVRIDGNASELVEDDVTQDLLYQGENLMLQCDGTQWWVL